MSDRPSVLWLFIEDMNDWMSCFGDTVVETPHIDGLAASGVRFDRAYMPAGVCSPSRSAVITGMVQTTLSRSRDCARGNRFALRLCVAHRSAGGTDFVAAGGRWYFGKHGGVFIQRSRDAAAPTQAVYLRRGP